MLFGSSTGRDGIGGASVLASAGFGTEEDDADKRPSVQVGDPFEEKRLIEACLEMLDAGLVVGIQDLGAAGITGAASETASKGGVGHGPPPRRRARAGGGHGALRDHDQREPGADAGHRRARTTWPSSWPSAPGGRSPRRSSARSPAPAGSASSTGSGARCSPTSPRPRSTTTPPATTGPSPSPPTRATARPTRARCRPAGRRGGRPARAAHRPALGLQPVRPPALPQHRRGAGRRRHGAPAQAPD